MSLYFVGAGPGDPKLLTLKAYELLQNCDLCLWAGSLINPDILKAVTPKATIVDSAPLDLNEIVDLMEKFYREGKKVVRLHTGDPSIYGAIAEQMTLLDEKEIPYEVVPGVSSFQATAAALKMELTLPEVTQTVILSRVEGATPVPDHQSLEVLAQSRSTLCLFLSVSKIEEITKRLSPFYGKDCPIAVVYKASWPDQVIMRGTFQTIASKIAEHKISKTAMIVVGPAITRQGGKLSKLYDPKFTHEYREGKSS